jgi:hypothetical protein
MKVEDQIRIVRELVEDYFDNNAEYSIKDKATRTCERAHIVAIGTSVLCTKWDIGYPGGSFVQAVVNNNLMQAVGSADSINIHALKFYVQLMYNNSMPEELWLVKTNS